MATLCAQSFCLDTERMSSHDSWWAIASYVSSLMVPANACRLQIGAFSGVKEKIKGGRRAII